MKKILVIGSGGAGKSTFSRQLGALLDIEVIHLDVHYWKPDWVATPDADWRERVETLLARESWIMDGNYSGTLELRLAACDTVIFLDLPRTVCLWRVLKRMVLQRNGRRPDMAEGCGEQFNTEFLRWVWNYPNRSRQRVIDRLKQHSANKLVIFLRNNGEVRDFLNSAAGLRPTDLRKGSALP